MTIAFTQEDREIFMKRFKAAEKMDRPHEVTTVFHIVEVAVGQNYE
jgi:hypothetical protein